MSTFAETPENGESPPAESEKTLALDLGEMRKEGTISAEEEAMVLLKDAVNKDILSNTTKDEGEKSETKKKKKKLSSKLSSSKAKTKEMFEASRREQFEELNQPASSDYPTSMFPEPVVIQETSRRGSSKSGGGRPRPKGRSEVVFEGDGSVKSHEQIGNELESDHAKKVALEKETEKARERKWRREAKEVPSYPEEGAEGQGQGDEGLDDALESLLRNLEPAAEVTNIDKAMMAKEEGNEFFRSKNYDFALQQYSQAIRLCPREGIFDSKGAAGDGDNENAERLAVFLGNRAAAFFMMGAWAQCETDCDLSLQLKPGYVKVLVRRSTCLEKLEKYEDALRDAKAVQQEDPTFPRIDELVARLQRAHNQKMEQMKEEAMGKLKDLGNSILGNFGMSLDQFKFNQNPDGTWSMGGS